MTERRPHWDDELIQLVRHHSNLYLGEATVEEFSESVYSVIAVVEDWERERNKAHCDALADLYEDAEDRIEEMAHAVLALHTREHYSDYDICKQCSEDRMYQWWPCPTAAAIHPPDTPKP